MYFADGLVVVICLFWVLLKVFSSLILTPLEELQPSPTA